MILKFLNLCLLVGLIQAQDNQGCFGEGTLPRNFRRQDVLNGAEKFGIDIFRNIALNYSSTSFIMSPYSIFGVLKLTYYGSAGTTERELQTALNMPSKRDAYWVSNAINAERKVSGAGISEMDKAYFANDIEIRQCALGTAHGIERIDFKNGAAAARQINADVSEATRGEINNFLTPGIVQDARFVLINAVYFKGKWVNQFDKLNTRDAPFYDENQNALKTPARMMEAKAKFGYTQYDPLKAEVVELPYENSSISMMVLLPNEGTTVNGLLKALDENHIQQMKNNLRTSSIVTVNLPSFNFTTKLNSLLKNSLKQAGIVSLFSQSAADLSNYTPEQVYVDSTLHQATIRVDEEGTVASAVTGLVITRTGVEKNIVFNANRPFLFIIRDQDLGISYFIGLYRDPAHSKVL